MSIFSTAVEKPITTLMIFLAVMVVGVFSYVSLPVDQYPKMDPPYITVMATYPGANAADIEQNVTKILEDNLNSVDDLEEIQSVSYDNLAVVTMEFDWGINLDNAANDVRDAVDKAMNSLPDDLDRPTIMRMSTSMMPCLIYAVTADESFGGLYKILDEKVIMNLNRVDGVASAYVAGLPERVVYVDLDPTKLDAYGLSIESLGGKVLQENMDVSAGSVKVGLEDFSLRVEGEFEESQDIAEIPIGMVNGKTLKIKDVATVRDTLRDITLEQMVDRRYGGMLLVTKTSDANAVQVCEDAKKEIEEAMKSLPTDIEFKMVNDSSDFITDAIDNLKSTIFDALLAVVVVVFVFLGRWRSTFIIAMTIPISLIAAFIYLFATDGSLNFITLMSLSIAIGMVVDDAIVVLENITKHVDRGSRPREAAKYGTNEVWTSVIVTTLVTIAVFFPLTLIPGIMGIFFKPLGWIICISITVSTFAAISLTPMLSSKFLRLRSEEEDKKKKFSFYLWSKKTFDGLDAWYEKVIRWVLVNKYKTIISMSTLFIVSLFFAKYIPTEFFPQNDMGTLTIYAKMQQGQRVEETRRIALEIDSVIRNSVPETRLLTTSYGSEETASMASMMSTTGNNIMNMRFRAVDTEDRERTIFQIADQIRGILKTFPEVLEYEVSTSGGGGSTTNTVDIEIIGHDFNTTTNFAQLVARELKSMPGAEDILISRGDDKTELQIIFDREKLARHGLTTTAVGMSLRNSVYGYRNSKFKEDGEEYDIIVRLEEQYRESITDVENLIITDAYGQKVRLKELGEVRESFSPPSIERKSKQRYLKVSITPGEDYAMGDIANAAQDLLDRLETPQGVTTYIGGSYEDQQESFGALILLMSLALMLVYIVMAAEFESYLMPFIIMLSIPFAFTGVIISLLLTGSPLSIVAALGAVMLIGIVTKNGIVLIDYINLMRERGYRMIEAVALSCRSRLRPVLMTSLTTILGMVPMAISTGDGAETWRPMGIAVIGGMVFSTIITLLIVPAVYAATDKSGSRDKVKAEKASYHFMDDFDAERDLPEHKKNN